MGIDTVVNEKEVSKFIKWLGQNSEYALSSIERVIGPSLKRLSGADISPALSHAYRDNKRIGQK